MVWVWEGQNNNKKNLGGWKAFQTNVYFVQRSAIRYPATMANSSILNDGLHTERTCWFFTDFSSLLNEHIPILETFVKLKSRYIYREVGLTYTKTRQRSCKLTNIRDMKTIRSQADTRKLNSQPY